MQQVYVKHAAAESERKSLGEEITNQKTRLTAAG
jgi:hypothetical protein